VLALADLQSLLAQAEAAITRHRTKAPKVLADGLAGKLSANGFPVREVIDA